MKKNRFIPYGYTVRNGRTIIEQEEAEIVRDIFRDYIQGASLKEIADGLTARRVPYTEKTDCWDKARIARIIENGRYAGNAEYDPIIDGKTYDIALATKTARQRYSGKNSDNDIELIRPHIRCAACGMPMTRHINTNRAVRESWCCTGENCGAKVRISDNELLRKIVLLMNRLIENAELMVPRTACRKEKSPLIKAMENEIEQELLRAQPSEEYILARINDMASQLYRESNAKEQIIGQLARKRVSMMHPQEFFSHEYFTDMVASVLLSADGHVTIITKTQTEIAEGKDQ